jgi:hypothetical protein
MFAASALNRAVVMQEEQLTAARAFKDPFRALDLEVVLDYIAQEGLLK